jgi:predicted dehydrogenase
MGSHVSRRDFLATTTGAAGALAAARTIPLAPGHIPDATRPVAPSDRLHLGIIGVGMQGSGLLATAIKLPGVECVAACDLYDGRHALAREIVNPRLKVTRRYQELLADKDIDCLIVAVPDHWHKQVVVDAMAAGKDVYCEKPMSHSVADGVDMVNAERQGGRILQVGSQRVSSTLLARARELYARGIIGDLMLVEGSLGRNDPTGAWQYPPPPDLSPANLDWDTWQGTVPRRAFDPVLFARWRCWKEYGTGVAGDLLVHLVSGMLFVLGLNEPPARAMSSGGILRWPDGRNMPDVHATLFEYGKVPVYLRLNLGTERSPSARSPTCRRTGRTTGRATTRRPSPRRCRPRTRSSGTPTTTRSRGRSR